MGVGLVWLVVGPGYARALAGAVRLVAPVLERAPGTRYEVEGSRIHVVRPVQLGGEGRSRELVSIVWDSAGSFACPLLAALVLATPGWGWGRRARALLWGLGLLSLTEVAFVLVTSELLRQMPVTNPAGGVLYLPGRSALGLRIVEPLFAFFVIMGRGFFALLVYFGLIAFGWESARVGRR